MRFSCAGLKQLKLGGWESSKMRVKVNGRWAYFYPSEGEIPLNDREPISFETAYIPPNHHDEKFDAFYMPKEHPAHEVFMRKNVHSKAPFVYVAPNGKRRPNPTPTAWRGKLDKIPQYKNPMNKKSVPLDVALPIPPKERRVHPQWRSVVPSPAPIDIMFHEVEAPKTQIITPRDNCRRREMSSSLMLSPQRIQTGKGKYRHNATSAMKLTV